MVTRMTVSTAEVDEAPEPPRAPEREARPKTFVVTAPSLDDPVANLGSDGFGGVIGRRARLPRSRATVAFLLLVLTLLSTAVGIGMRQPCFSTAWTGGGNQQYTHMCYTDIPFMYQGRGFSQGEVAYYSTNPNNYLEYPVITGAAMETAALLARHVPGDANNQGRWFYVFTTWFLLAFAAITVVALIGISGPRPWDAAMFAIAPGLMLNGTINWDLIAVGLAAVGAAGLGAQQADPGRSVHRPRHGGEAVPRPVAGGAGAVVLAGREDEGLGAVHGSARSGSWLAVNLPFMIENWHSWIYFYTFNENRGADWGSLWLFLEYSPLHMTFNANQINTLFAVLLAVSCVGIGLIAWLARNRPRVAQIAFLAAAAFILFNKVYSPQYVLWLIPLAVLARPRWRDFLIWQACEVIYYGAIWLYLITVSNDANRGLPEGGYDFAIAIHIGGTLFFVVQVIRDIFDNRRDPVRAGGFDDPGGGVLDQAPDVYGFRDPFAPAVVPAQARADKPTAKEDDGDAGERDGETASESEPDADAIEVVELGEEGAAANEARRPAAAVGRTRLKSAHDDLVEVRGGVPQLCGQFGTRLRRFHLPGQVEHRDQHVRWLGEPLFPALPAERRARPVDRRQPGAQQLLGSRRQAAQDARRFEPDALHGSAADHDDPAVLPGSGLPIADSVAALYREGVEHGRTRLDGGGLAEPELGPDPRPEPSAGTGTLQPGDFHAAQMADVYRPHPETSLSQGLDPRHRLGRRIGRGGPVQRQVQREAVDLLSAERLGRERQIGAGKALASQ